MSTSKCHRSWEGELREILLVVFTRICRFWKGAFGRKSPISTGRNERLKSPKLLNLFGNIANKARQLSMSLP